MKAAALIFAALAALFVLTRWGDDRHPLALSVTPAAACDPIDHRTPGYRHPWHPITDRDKDPRTVA